MKSIETDVQNQVNAKDKEIISLRQQLLRVEDDREKTGRDQRELEHQVSQLKQDLATMTTENQAIHGELRKVVQERDQLAKNIEGYTQRLVNLEEQLTIKVGTVVLVKSLSIKNSLK